MTTKFKISTGRTVIFNEYLVPDGIAIYVQNKLSSSEKKLFRNQIQTDRDVYTIKF